ncbi:hypothetical protein SLH49_15360 [Cognatiyoonia sp. IB215446]|uniref:hypothetical protein n=1 Tax=Cognatiyoonia sp. IB215446 TaxID=3097355 RepID=UPI002A162A15|nr:hypothetical protein [Cognatiyoonia sp. IB215446]MDX8349364.1 hypothetical protein [Cognatiyoonia sp. IB215446]
MKELTYHLHRQAGHHVFDVGERFAILACDVDGEFQKERIYAVSLFAGYDLLDRCACWQTRGKKYLIGEKKLGLILDFGCAVRNNRGLAVLIYALCSLVIRVWGREPIQPNRNIPAFILVYPRNTAQKCPIETGLDTNRARSGKYSAICPLQRMKNRKSGHACLLSKSG